MRTITYHLLTNQVTESDSVYPNAFSADDNTTQLIFDFTGTACESWDKWLDLTMSDYTKDVQHLGTDAIVSFNLGAEHTKKGLLQVNPYAKNGTDKHGFPIYKLTIERQLNNSVVDASAQQSMIDHFDARLSVKAVNTTTLGAGESATVAITVEDDGTTYAFGVPQGLKGDTGLKGDKGDKGAQWRGAYSAGTAYVVDDVVSYNGSSYICILASTGNLPTDVTYWSLLAQKGTDGGSWATASDLPNVPAGNISATNVQAALNELDTEKASSGDVVTAANGKKYKIVSFVIRNNGASNWEAIDDTTHSPVNIGTITTSATDITVNFGWAANKIGSFVCVPDETFAEAGYQFGSSVGINSAIIRCVRNAKVVSGYIAFDGSNWTVAGAVGNLAVTGFSAGTLSLSHDSIGEFGANVSCRDGAYIPAIGSLGSNSAQIKFYDYAGNLVTTASTSMKAYFLRMSSTQKVNPQTLNVSGANIWCFGVFEIS